jgi:hypothetical protein
MMIIFIYLHDMDKMNSQGRGVCVSVAVAYFNRGTTEPILTKVNTGNILIKRYRGDLILVHTGPI